MLVDSEQNNLVRGLRRLEVEEIRVKEENEVVGVNAGVEGGWKDDREVTKRRL